MTIEGINPPRTNVDPRKWIGVPRLSCVIWRNVRATLNLKVGGVSASEEGVKGKGRNTNKIVPSTVRTVLDLITGHVAVVVCFFFNTN